jgi:hypothetical protein
MKTKTTSTMEIENRLTNKGIWVTAKDQHCVLDRVKKYDVTEQQ